MLKILFSSSLVISLLGAVSIDELVNDSFEKNYDIKSLEKSIEIANHQIAIAKNWENPMIAFKTNEIMFDKPLSNQKEYGVELSQAIPIGKKLDIEENIAKNDRNIQIYSLEDKKLELESKIYEYSYNILIFEKRYELLNTYQKNLKKLENLNTLLQKYEKATLNEVIDTQISSLDLKLEQENLKNSIDNLYLNLEQITYKKVDSITQNLDIKRVDKEKATSNLSSHPQVKTLEENSTKYSQMASLEDAKKFSSVTLSLEYMQNKEQDYGNVTVAIPLPIYKTENVNRIKAKLNANETNDKLDSLLHNLSLETQIYVNNLNQNVRNYEVIQKEIIPLKQKIQKNIENYNSFEKSNPQDSIKNLNELITYELKALDEVQKYYENYSKLLYYSNKGIK
ncbi:MULTISPECIES: TolC family protein [Arcobacteraceae]|uniref:TolC family protein n=2 Tax=Arcobacteraceae TaxID=2808963 RepID=A0AAP4PXF5_9BACT|nr:MULTISPECIES: TolC family protein [Arcobacteraceae]MCG3656506.1 TolC family protein [Aliarcobacter butzleri]MCT7585692.1 TolC family protein [Aliarcobacter butzleri]MDK2051232.1 TolC family protein [Aliarcobacter butzleri]MDN5051501.1 TolC family protein [Aliarcobacter butzleri]MDN5075331.1 TolC family protein [Aliarcobacter butzleri]